MIDIHSHILNNVDDGSNSLENSLTILEKAEQAGFTDIVLTPHYIENYYINSKDIIKEKIKELKQSIYDKEIIIQLHQGNEILLTEKTPNLLKQKEISTIANSRYILFELPFSNKMMSLNAIINEIKLGGFIPILAHPERYSYIQEDPNSLIEIIKMGVLVQSNYGSILGQYGKAAKHIIEILLENKLINFLASDTHKQGFIYENFKEIQKKLIEITEGDTKYINELTTINPQKILDDIDIYTDCPNQIQAKTKKRLWSFI